MAEHWVTKSSQEPRPSRRKQEYTRAQRWANWWDYHWHLVLGGIALAAIGGYILWNQLQVVKPDYDIALCARQNLPADTAARLEEALADFGQDRNGDGRVVVRINQYTVDFSQGEDSDAYSQMAGVTRLWADMQAGTSYLYLTDDLEGLAAAQNLDPQSLDTYPWTGCPVLTGLDLGSYDRETLVDSQGGDSQEYMARFTLLHRGGEVQPEDEAFWEAITEGAAE